VKVSRTQAAILRSMANGLELHTYYPKPGGAWLDGGGSVYPVTLIALLRYGLIERAGTKGEIIVYRISDAGRAADSSGHYFWTPL
jgi:DNA-binding PadR family transcriptional regulator